MGINENISRLSNLRQEEFEFLLTNVLYSREWCSFHGIDYSNPDVTMAKEELYKESFAPSTRFSR